MTRRKPKPKQRPERLKAPTSEYSDAQGNTLALRGSLTAATRVRYAEVLAGAHASAATTREDAWQRAVELLFEQLAVRWTIAGAAIERQRELLARFRAASPAERTWVRDTLREHCEEHFPDVKAP
ncbi:MAG TPA: hypothetical protein VGI76_06830 [Solirubrobacteraceae bacterium]